MLSEVSSSILGRTLILGGEKNLEILFSHIGNGIVITDQYSTILYVNPAFSKITEYQFDEVIGNNPGILHSGRHDKDFYEKMWGAILLNGFWEGEIWNRKKSGAIYPELLTISKIDDIKNSKHYFLSIFNDISFLREGTVNELNLAFYDPLTKLPNRSFLKERLVDYTKSAKRAAGNKPAIIKRAAFCFADLNKFKEINDNFGHLVGDKILQHVANVMSLNIREEDTVSRIGGDEFVFLLKNIEDDENINKIFERIERDLEKPITINGKSISISMSIGVVYIPISPEEIDYEKLIQMSDEAMYHAKKNKLGIVYWGEFT